MTIAPLIVIVALVWLISETLKYLIRLKTEERAYFGDSGGMPSSHASVMAATATVAGLQDGFDSSVFGLAVVVTAIVAHDAVRLRGMVGSQGTRLNALLAASQLADKSPLYIWRGHRLREVAAGLVLGSVLATGLHYALNLVLVAGP